MLYDPKASEVVESEDINIVSLRRHSDGLKLFY
jgi:hypothetical protein